MVISSELPIGLVLPFAFDLMPFEAQNKGSDRLEVAGTKNASGSFLTLKNQGEEFLFEWLSAKKKR